MIHKAQQIEGNVLLEVLPPEALADVLDACEVLNLGAGASLVDPEKPVEHVYFPTTAVLSILSVMADRSSVETAVTGSEGMAPLAAFHDVSTSTEQLIVQVPGYVLKVPLPVFTRVLQEHREFRNAAHHFSMAIFTLTAQTSGCNRRHSVVQRCARWLLQTHDRVPGDDFTLTHLFLSQMLGVRRSSVTVAAEALRSAGAVSYTRGSIKVVDREKLLARSCECYAIIRSAYDRLLPGAAIARAAAGSATPGSDESFAPAEALDARRVAAVANPQ